MGGTATQHGRALPLERRAGRARDLDLQNLSGLQRRAFSSATSSVTRNSMAFERRGLVGGQRVADSEEQAHAHPVTVDDDFIYSGSDSSGIYDDGGGDLGSDDDFVMTDGTIS